MDNVNASIVNDNYRVALGQTQRGTMGPEPLENHNTYKFPYVWYGPIEKQLQPLVQMLLDGSIALRGKTVRPTMKYNDDLKTLNVVRTMTEFSRFAQFYTDIYE